MFLKSSTSAILNCFFTLFFKCLVFKSFLYCHFCRLSCFLVVLILYSSSRGLYWRLYWIFLLGLLFFYSKEIIEKSFICWFLSLRKWFGFFFLLLFVDLCFNFLFFWLLFLHTKKVLHNWLWFLFFLCTTLRSFCFAFQLYRTLLYFFLFCLLLLSFFQLFLSLNSPFFYIFNSYLRECGMSKQKLLSFQQNIILFFFV